MPVRRTCLGCGRLTTDSRCPDCRKQQRAKYGGDWPEQAHRAVATHRATHGNWCPGWKTEPHESADLTLDHDGIVLCRACNSRKRNLGDG